MTKHSESNLNLSANLIASVRDVGINSSIAAAGFFLTIAPTAITGKYPAELVDQYARNVAGATIVIGGALAVYGVYKVLSIFEPSFKMTRQ